MDGVNSAAMRQRGIEYRLNFGVSIITLRQLASLYLPDADLAEVLWKEDVRELKILATLLYPVQQFRHANEWVAGIQNLELAEQACMNLFSKMPDAARFAAQWIQSPDFYTRLTGFLLYARLFMQNYTLSDPQDIYFQTVDRALHDESALIKNAALCSLKKLGIQNDSLANNILSQFHAYNEVYEELKFEFEFFGKSINFVPR